MNRMEKAMQEDCARNLARREPGVVPSIQLAEQAIAGMADIVRELNELREEKAQAAERYARWEQNEILIAEALRDDKRELLADRARLRSQWEVIPWSAIEEFLQATHYISLIVHGNDIPFAGELKVRAWVKAFARKEPLP